MYKYRYLPTERFIERKKAEYDELVEHLGSGLGRILFELIKSEQNNRSTFFTKELNTSVKNIRRWLVLRS